MGKYTDVEESNMKMEVDVKDSGGYGKSVSLGELPTLAPFQRVVCEVKVLCVEEEMAVSGGMRKQDVMVSDSTGTGRLTVWEVDIGKMEEGKCYRLNGVMVREFRKKKFLSTAKENCKIEMIDDIGVVDDLESGDEGNVEEGLKHNNVRVAGVETLTNYSGCMKCKSKVVCDADEPELGTCGKCGTMQCMADCTSEVTAHLIIRSGSGKLSLRAFGKVVEDIAEQREAALTKVSLLKARKFDMEIRDGIIRAVTRKVSKGK